MRYFKNTIFFFSKNRKNRWKKNCAKYFEKNNNFIFFEFFTENVFQPLLRGRETTRKKYRVVFEKCQKYIVFLTWLTRPSVRPSIKKFRGSKKADYHGKIEIQKTFSRWDIKQKEIKLVPHRGPLRWSPPGVKDFWGQKWRKTRFKLKSKKCF